MNSASPPAYPPTLPPGASRPAGVLPPTPPRVPTARGRVFRAVLFKEAREQSKSLGGVACASAIATWIALASAAVHYGPGSQQIALPDDYFRMCTFIPPTAAVWLGLAQFLPEMRPARLGLLFHRPISRGTSFAAKFLAGVVLYMLAVGLPLFAGLLWASSPRHMPFPFTWSMALIPLADILAGIPFYAAGALIALRGDARWLGSRIIPLAPALLCGVLNYIAFNFASSLLAIGITTALLGAAAAASFHPAMSFARQGRAAKAATTLMLIPSIALTGLVAIGLIMGLTESFDSPDYVSYDRAFLNDGTPVIRAYSSGSQSFGLLDTTGKVLGSPSITNAYQNPDLRTPVSIRKYDNGALPFHQPSHYFNCVGFEGETYWYLSRRGDYLVGYDVARCRLAGAIGPAGFAPAAAAPPQRFSPPLQSFPLLGGQVLSGGDTVYRVAADHLVPLFTIPDPEPILIAETLKFASPDGPITYFDGQITPTFKADRPKLIAALLTKSSIWFVSLEATPPPVMARFQGENLDSKNVAVDYAPQISKFLVLTADMASSPLQVDQPATVTYVSTDDTPARTLTIPAYPSGTYAGPRGPVQRFILPASTPPLFQAIQMPLALSPSPDAHAALTQLFTTEGTLA